MPRKKKQLTKEEHIKVAEAIYTIKDIYSQLESLFAENYGVTHRCIKLLHRAKYDQLRSELDCEFFNSHYHTSSLKYVSPYYGHGYESYADELLSEGE